MLVKVKYTNDEAAALYRKASGDLNKEVPFKVHDDDFCYDCVATKCEEIAPRVYRYDLGLSFQIVDDIKFLDRGDIILDIDGRARSSVWKTGMVLANCEATIDKGYTGKVYAVFYHVLDNMPKYEVGDRVCQIKIGATIPMNFIVVDEFDETSRGEGGFGSTGK